MLFNRDQLAMNLCYLAGEDYTLLNEIIYDYVMNKIDNKEMDHYEWVINNNLSEII